MPQGYCANRLKVKELPRCARGRGRTFFGAGRLVVAKAPTLGPMEEDAARSRRVSLPMPVVAGLVVALVGCLLALAWLLGRESGRRLARDPGPPIVASPESVPSAPGISAPIGPTPAPMPSVSAPLARAPAPAPTPAGVAPPTPTPEARTPAPPSPEAAAVARYFDELEALSSARYWDDPQTLAMSIVQDLAGGGTGGIDRLRSVQVEVEAAVRRMSVPEPCREHHRRSLELFAAAGRLLQSLSEGAAKGDLSGMMSATAEAERLQAGAEELRALEASLRRRYGLPPAPS